MVRAFVPAVLLLAALAAQADPPHARKPAAPAAEAKGEDEGLEALGARLAERLGARQAPGGDGSFVLRVPARDRRAAAAAAPAPGASAPRVAAARPAPPSLCDSGKRQSPIDIRNGIKVDLDPVQFDYRPGAFRVADTGRLVQFHPAPGNGIEVLGRRYALQHVEFHRPAPERVDGRSFAMGVHLVHRADDGRTAIVALLVEEGGAHPVLQAALNNLPLEKGDEAAALAPLDPVALLPQTRGHYTYMGSLIAPPCTEGVLWMVMKQPVQASREQIAIFDRLYPATARAVQPLGGRLIKESR